MLTTLRWYCLITGLVSVVLSTFLYERIGRPWANAAWRRVAPPGEEIPAFLLNPIIQRVWGIVSGVMLLLLWWYLGTADGAAHFESAFGAWRRSAL
jgi:hypothetical protein